MDGSQVYEIQLQWYLQIVKQMKLGWGSAIFKANEAAPYNLKYRIVTPDACKGQM